MILDTAHRRKVVTTDASNKGWGALCEGKPTFGLWSEEESGLHINCLEMLAVCRACQVFLPNNFSSEECTLHPLSVQKIWEDFGRTRVDFFASEGNSHCPIFFTKSTDALAHEWPSLPLHVFPPIALLPQVLRRVREQRHKLFLIAPLWRNQPWVCQSYSSCSKQPLVANPLETSSLKRMARYGIHGPSFGPGFSPGIWGSLILKVWFVDLEKLSK